MPTQDTQINTPEGNENPPEKPKTKAEVTAKIIEHFDLKATEKITSVSRSLQKLEQATQ